MLALGANGRGRAGLLSALRPQDVFATSLTTGTGSSQSVTTGFSPDLAWRKIRSSAGNHTLQDRLRGQNFLSSNTTNAESSISSTLDANGFTTTGISGETYVTWTFRQADKFFKQGLFTHANGTDDFIDLSSLGVVGWVHIKRRDAAGDWYVWTRGLTFPNNLVLNTTAAASNTNAFIVVNGTTVRFLAGAPSGNYVIEAWAHDPDTTNGIVQCGSYTVDGSGNANLPFPYPVQFFLTRPANATDDWTILDTSRGARAQISANTSAAEATNNFKNLTSSAYTMTGLPSSYYNTTWIYMMIRAPI